MRRDFSGIAEREAVYLGPEFARPFSAVINSHQTLRPGVAQNWVKATFNAVTELAESDAVIISSLGLISYEWPLWYAGQQLARQIVVAPVRDLSQTDQLRRRILTDFALDPALTGFFGFRSAESIRKSKERDRVIFNLADWVYPVSVRPSGHLQQLLATLPETRIQRKFQIPFEHIKAEIIRLDQGQLAPLDLDQSWLTHWTRRNHKPFSRDDGVRLTAAEFYQALALAGDEDICSACQSLARILQSGVIRASADGIRGQYPVVSFTALTPAEILPLMKWNSARVRFTFEPFGIAIKKATLEKLGARPVIYGNNALFNALPESERPFYQAEGKQQQWLQEREWRIQGHLALNRIPVADLCLLTPNPTDAEKLSQRFKSYRITSLTRACPG